MSLFDKSSYKKGESPIIYTFVGNKTTYKKEHWHSKCQENQTKKT